jgi:hypothetical protein
MLGCALRFREQPMSEVELVSLYHEAISVFFTVVTLMTSLLFAYLVAMFFMAHRLGIALFFILNVLYAMVSFALSSGMLAAGKRAALIGQEILTQAAQPGSVIDFLDGSLFIPMNAPSAMTWFVRVAIVLSLLYAVLHRKAQREVSLSFS